MKRLIAVQLLLGSLSASWAAAQTCKPDLSREDKITKERVDVWTHGMFSTSIGSSLLSSSTDRITLSIGRFGNFSAINLQIEKRERSAVNAMLESERRGAVGKPFYLGFKGGEPVVLTITDVSNTTTRGRGLSDNQIITTIVLSATVDDARLGTLRGALTSRPIDAVRMALVGDLQLEQSVNEKNGEGMKTKFACFYQALDSRGVAFSGSTLGTPTPASAEDRPASTTAELAGRYAYVKNAASYFELSADGGSNIHTGGQDYRGTYGVVGDTVVLRGTFQGQTVTSTYRIGDSSMTSVNNGGVWQKDITAATPSATPSSAEGTPVTLEQVIQMVTAKLPDDVIVAAVQKSPSRPAINPDALIRLKKAGVSDAILRALMK